MEILEIANEKYNLNWDTKSEIGNRLIWFRQLDLVDFNEVTHKYFLTEAGKEFVKNIEYVQPDEIEINEDSTIHENELSVSDWAMQFVI